MISVDDHVVEPPHTFEGRLPAALQERAPRIVETAAGHQVWEFEGERYTQVGMNAVAGRRPETREARAVPLRPDAPRLLRRRRPRPRHGHQRRVGVGELPVADHRVLRSRVLQRPRPRARRRVHPRVERLALRGVVRRDIPTASSRSASRTSPTRSSPSDEIRRNAARGFTSVTFPERPHAIGLPSLWERDHWDPIIEACVETDTVISLARGQLGDPSGTRRVRPSTQLGATLFGQLSLGACAEWLWSGYPVQAPGPQDRDERGRHRLGRDAARPARQHRRPLRATASAGTSGPPTC